MHTHTHSKATVTSGLQKVDHLQGLTEPLQGGVQTEFNSNLFHSHTPLIVCIECPTAWGTAWGGSVLIQGFCITQSGGVTVPQSHARILHFTTWGVYSPTALRCTVIKNSVLYQHLQSTGNRPACRPIPNTLAVSIQPVYTTCHAA